MLLLSKIKDDQAQKLLSLTEAPKDNHKKLSGKYDWLLDGSALYHMTANISLLQNLCNLTPMHVGMLNGAIAFASKHGSVKLNDHLILRDVLYVPRLNYKILRLFFTKQVQRFNIKLIKLSRTKCGTKEWDIHQLRPYQICLASFQELVIKVVKRIC